jgi:hypothetical protein
MANDGKSPEQKEVLSVLERFQIFPDVPLFGSGEAVNSSSDAFNHEAFAETIFRLLTLNKPPLSIGLFGSWGIGKSTIINILRTKIANNPTTPLKLIYFNAWKYSGDSFRRQFLIEVAKQIFGDDHDEVLRIQQLNHSEVLKKSHQRSLAVTIAQALKDAFSVKIALRGDAVARLVIGCTSVIACAVLSTLASRWSPQFATFLLAIAVPAVFVWFAGMKFDQIFVLHDKPIFDPKLIFPEQFEAEFRSLVQSKLLEGKTPVIAIDDIDRCEPSVIKDILICMKNFMGQENCFFVVPCDDKTVVDIFTEPNQKEGYKDESLRKYFNVMLRVPPITGTDLVDFANSVARQTGIGADIVELAVLANCRDARKMKHFLNSLEMKYQVAKVREKAGLMPQIVDSNLAELAKAVLLEDAYPALFRKIVDSPRIYKLVEDAALGAGSPAAELGAYGLEDWQAQFPGLREILDRTRAIKMEHADVFFPLKSTNTEVRIPRGTELKTAIVEGNEKAIEEIALQIQEQGARTATAELVIDLLHRRSGPFLTNSISAGLTLYHTERFFPAQDRSRLGRVLLEGLLYKSQAKILAYKAEQVLGCAKAQGSTKLNEALDAYAKAINGLPLPEPPDNIVNIVSAIYDFSPEKSTFASILNGKFEHWVTTGNGVAALDKLSALNSLPREEKIPNHNVVLVILNSMTAGIQQVPPEYAVRRAVLFANWEPDFAPIFTQTLVTMLQNNNSATTYNPIIEFAISSVLLNPDLAHVDGSDKVWQTVTPLPNRLTDAKGKSDAIKAVIVFACNGGASKNTACSQILQIWRTQGDAEIREGLSFAESINPSASQPLLKSCIEQELSLAEGELQQPSDRTAERVRLCLDYQRCILSSAVADLLIRGLEVPQPASLTRWLVIIDQIRDRLSKDHDFDRKYVVKCLDLVPTIPGQIERQQALLTAALGTFPRLGSEDQKVVVEKYFALLKDQQPGTRAVAAGKLSTLRTSMPDSQDLRTPVQLLLGDMRRDIKTAELLQYRQVFDALLTQADMFGDVQHRDLADLSKRSMSHSDPSFQEFGVSIVERMPQVPPEEAAQITDLLEALENSSPTLKERASRLLQRSNQKPSLES